MLEIALIILPLFILVGMGYLSVKMHLVKPDALPSIGNLIMYFAIPAVIINAVGRTEFSDLLEPWFLLAYALGSVGAMLFGLLAGRFLFKGRLSEGAIQGLGMSVPNSMFIGFPLLVLLFPDNPPTVAFVMAVLIENMLTLPLAMILLEVAVSREQAGVEFSGKRVWQIVSVRLMKNPMLVAIVFGVLVSLLDIQWPEPVDKILQLLSQMTAALALLFLGITLASNRLQRVSATVGLTAFGKLVLHPGLVFLLVLLLPDFDPVLQAAVVVIAAAPMLTIYPIIGERYGHREFCANTLMFSMLVSFFTLVMVLHGVRSLG
ncbi:MAG: AEC family transporter [Thiolinea sp.]